MLLATSTISIRVPELIRKEVDEFTCDEKLSQISESVRKLLLIGLQKWREEKAIERLQRGDITFNKAAELARMDVWSFADLLNKSDVVWIRMSSEEMRKDIEAALK